MLRRISWPTIDSGMWPRMTSCLTGSQRAAGSRGSAVAVMHRMVGFRNVIVHEYLEVDVGIVRDVVENRTGDLQRFVDAVRAKLAAV